MKHRYPRRLRERYLQKKADAVMDKLDGKFKIPHFDHRVIESKAIADMISMNNARIQLLLAAYKNFYGK